MDLEALRNRLPFEFGHVAWRELMDVDPCEVENARPIARAANLPRTCLIPFLDVLADHVSNLAILEIMGS
jgi:hypothetical protein